MGATCIMGGHDGEMGNDQKAACKMGRHDYVSGLTKRRHSRNVAGRIFSHPWTFVSKGRIK